MNPQFSDFVQRLEAERHDLSYRSRPEQPVRVVEVVKTKRSREREQKMYHAGRFAAGARDGIAVAAAEWLEKDLAKSE